MPWVRSSGYVATLHAAAGGVAILGVGLLALIALRVLMEVAR